MLLLLQFKTFRPEYKYFDRGKHFNRGLKHCKKFLKVMEISHRRRSPSGRKSVILLQFILCFFYFRDSGSVRSRECFVTSG